MSEKKSMVRFFTIAEWEEEEIFLRGMHREGWKLKRVGFPAFYHFERCAPEDVIYRLDYRTPDARDREDYHQLFRDCGWEHVTDFFGYAYFRKPAAEASGEEDIFTDEASLLDMLKTTLKWRLIPAIVICLIAIALCGLFDAEIAWVALIPAALLLTHTAAKFRAAYERIKKRLRR